MTSILERIRSKQPISFTEAKAYFDERPPVRPSFLLGEWKGTPLETGNKLVAALQNANWAGKDFHGVDHVEPMVCLDDKGCRFPNPYWGGARIREVKYNDVVSAAMVYNERPVIDYFRYVDENTVIGVMDSPEHDSSSQEGDRLYFVLERIK
ncbi:hypothetical protein BO79DRAFT_216047 [Aspergillus costaricaensis CBS 115574]|uniref:Uncharacterized protein n=1 Tax=Aspergillus costaricaensis CBS 115574 TaxID=1448317 RepID=A0ACD1IIR6_9EURO|nr:hypothetical protein BO79DRAFT_216047 [Aspergillus costaricaensis CBS 115574]RAK90466.1 hypothetical protein BO79DRAFT_216047 [Aspergillus costaricaensis CBS 115574]